MTLLQITQDKLHSINNRITHVIANNVDETTGEISESVLEDLENLELAKSDIVQVCGLSYHQYKSLGEQVKAEKQRLNDLQKQYDNSMESFKKLMDKILQGDSFECENFKVSYHKSKVIEADENLNMEEFNKLHPELVRKKYELDKTAAKKISDLTGTLPSELTIVEKNNIQIK